jgi:hypothetical protein
MSCPPKLGFPEIERWTRPILRRPRATGAPCNYAMRCAARGMRFPGVLIDFTLRDRKFNTDLLRELTARPGGDGMCEKSPVVSEIRADREQ